MKNDDNPKVKQLPFNILKNDDKNIKTLRLLDPSLSDETGIIRFALERAVASFDPNEVKRARRKIQEVKS